MKKEFLDILCCPTCKHNLVLLDDERTSEGEIWSGTLHCEQCALDYPISDGIPSLLPPGLRE